jgi:hypothetical protein
MLVAGGPLGIRPLLDESFGSGFGFVLCDASAPRFRCLARNENATRPPRKTFAMPVFRWHCPKCIFSFCAFCAFSQLSLFAPVPRVCPDDGDLQRPPHYHRCPSAFASVVTLPAFDGRARSRNAKEICRRWGGCTQMKGNRHKRSNPSRRSPRPLRSLRLSPSIRPCPGRDKDRAAEGWFAIATAPYSFFSAATRAVPLGTPQPVTAS